MNDSKSEKQFCFQFESVLFELNEMYHLKQLKLYKNLMIIHRSHLDVFIYTLHGTKGINKLCNNKSLNETFIIKP